MPSGASGQATLAQLPRLRVTGRTVPRGACPMTGVTVVGPLYTSAEGTVTVNTVSCADTSAGLIVRARTTAAARRIISFLLQAQIRCAADGFDSRDLWIRRNTHSSRRRRERRQDAFPQEFC